VSDNKIKELEKQFSGDLDLMLFYVSYIKNGLNATAAYRELHKDVTVGSAEVLGSRMLGKVKEKIGLQAIMSLYGLDLDLYLTQLKDGNLAQKRDQFSGEMSPDHKTREVYHTKLGKLLGIETDQPVQPPGVAVQINFNSDKYLEENK